ncbi:unnamed protein product [Rangifer tarandus platyrhynchus]|uniref:Uncharacterized protein n=1 Tax=Rangifer tarandus platyrhynchus TaxID=3082113 RepID=A0ABN9A5L3_RANTA|nr:unnamed protein product [Rangifer tarandus platyrhynchus]CAI9689821.1 unnamed protein product [Rangifer tarandus platyrhynchus]
MRKPSRNLNNSSSLTEGESTIELNISEIPSKMRLNYIPIERPTQSSFVTVEEMVLVDVRSTCWLVQDEERKAVKPVPTAREDDHLGTEQTLKAVCEMKVEERRREAAIARPLAWGLKVARPVAWVLKVFLLC